MVRSAESFPMEEKREMIIETISPMIPVFGVLFFKIVMIKESVSVLEKVVLLCNDLTLLINALQSIKFNKTHQ